MLIVSIHAPVMDAKDISDAIGGIYDVSIHAPVMDANYTLGVVTLE